MAQRVAARGMQAFTLIWAGQLVSLTGSGLTRFALGVWLYQQRGSATELALVFLFPEIARLVMSPLAGVLADRWNRRWVMLLSDSGAAVGTLIIALLFITGRLEVWHIYLVTAANAAFETFQWPAYSAAVALLVPEQHFSRANGMVQLGRAAAQIVSPALAGALIVTSHLQGVILIDFATFLCAVTTLLIVHFPKPKTTVEGAAGRGTLLRETIYGWTYIAARPGLLGLLILITLYSFSWGFVAVLVTPLVLRIASAAVAGTIYSIGGMGMLVGSIMMSVWGGPKRRVYGVVGGGLLLGISVFMGGLRPSVWLIALAAFSALFSLPIITSSAEAIFQSKVAPDVQGRVFATRNLIASASLPLAYLAAGPLADYVFEPLLVTGGPLFGSVGQIIGVGPGRGIALLLIVMGTLAILTSLGGYLSPRLRLVEKELPSMSAEASVDVKNDDDTIRPEKAIAQEYQGAGDP